MYQKTTLSSLSSKKAELLIPERHDSSSKVLYVLDGDKLIPDLVNIFRNSSGISHPFLVSLPGGSRLDDYTPWPAPALSDRFADFGGKGDSFIHWLEHEVKPLTEETIASRFGWKPDRDRSVLLGYSLGGLLAVYASFLTDAFSTIVSVSGSFWYPQWDTFLASHVPVNSATRYLMLWGEREGAGKSNLQREAPAKALLTHQLLCRYTSPFPILTDHGGHHDMVKQRLEKAAAWIQEQP